LESGRRRKIRWDGNVDETIEGIIKTRRIRKEKEIE